MAPTLATPTKRKTNNKQVRAELWCVGFTPDPVTVTTARTITSLVGHRRPIADSKHARTRRALQHTYSAQYPDASAWWFCPAGRIACSSSRKKLSRVMRVMPVIYGQQEHRQRYPQLTPLHRHWACHLWSGGYIDPGDVLFLFDWGESIWNIKKNSFEMAISEKLWWVLDWHFDAPNVKSSILFQHFSDVKPKKCGKLGMFLTTCHSPSQISCLCAGHFLGSNLSLNEINTRAGPP